MAGEEILHSRCSAAVGHVHDVDACDLLELLGHDVARAAVALRRVGQLLRVGLGIVDQLLHRLGRNRGVNDQHVGRFRNQADRGEVLGGIVGQLQEMRQDRLRRVKSHIDGVAVGRRLGDEVGRDRAGGAGLVFGDGGFSALVELVREGAADDIGNAARRRRHDDPDRLRRILLGTRRQRGTREHARQQHGDICEIPNCSGHDVPPWLVNDFWGG